MKENREIDVIAYKLETTMDRVNRLEDGNRDLNIAIAEIRRDIAYIKTDIEEIKAILNKRNGSNSNTKIELKRYEFLVLVGSIILATLTVIMQLAKMR